MTRETETHFANLPEIQIGRSNLVIPFTLLGSCNVSEIIPIYWQEVLPGDGVKMKMSSVIRMTTPLVPVYDNAYTDIMFFFIPRRLTWEHWQQFWGETDTEPWIQQADYRIPKLVAPEKGWTKGSLAEKFGVPTNKGGYKWDAQYIRSYLKVYNDWFRDENLMNPAFISMGDSDTQGTDIVDYGTGQGETPFDYVTDAETGAMPLRACKPHDYYTSALPGIQRGPETYIPLGENAPIIGAVTNNHYTGGGITRTTWEDAVGKELGFESGSSSWTMFTDTSPVGLMPANTDIKLVTDLSNAVGASITQLRMSFMVQRFYEAIARSGSRYIELVKGIYGVTNPDYRLQRSEYCGGCRIPLNIAQVIQSDAGASDVTPLGHTGAMSHTSDVKEDLFNHSFTEHGILLGVMVTRTDHTYQQGLAKQFSRDTKFDFYVPQLSNISEQAIKNKEIYLQGDTVLDDDGNVVDEQAFGYQEAWAEYRTMNSVVTGELKSDYAQTLDVWHYADYYDSLPKLGDEWIQETDKNVQRTLAIEGHDQLTYNFFFKPTWTRPMPVYSIPGLSSHF